MAKKNGIPKPGDVYVRRHADGRYGVVWVTKLLHRTSCVIVTEYLDAAPPQLSDPRTRRPQRYAWWKRDPDTPCVTWFRGAPSAGFVRLGNRKPTAKELRLGGKDAGHGFGGNWQDGIGWQTLHAWRWQHDPEALRREAAEDEAAQAAAPPARSSVPAMPEAEFWRLIALIGPRQDERALAPLRARLARASRARIMAFDDCLAGKLHQLDGRRYAAEIGAHAYHGSGRGFSADHFLYVRCAAVALGRQAFARIVADPRLMPKDRDFEALLYVAQQAYQRKTAEDYEHVPLPSPETFENQAGWA